MKFQLLQPVFLIALFISCSSDTDNKNKIPDAGKGVATSGYDLQHPQKKWILPDELKEISGLTQVDKTHFLVIEDLHPNLYLLRMDTAAVIEKTIPFKETNKDKFDIEDLTLTDSTVYALWSHGEIFKISRWQGQPQVLEFGTPLSKENNTEGLCYDPVSGNLLIACKNESEMQDEKKSTRAIYEFDTKVDTLKSKPFLLIHKKDFKKLADEKLEFFPSAIAVHPVTHDIYILSTRETKCMAQYSYDGKLKSFQIIDKELMPQPEGICFSSNGTLYISTQGRHGNPAMIYEFGYSK